MEKYYWDYEHTIPNFWLEKYFKMKREKEKLELIIDKQNKLIETLKNKIE
jgi:hypothetical protein